MEEKCDCQQNSNSNIPVGVTLTIGFSVFVVWLISPYFIAAWTTLFDEKFLAAMGTLGDTFGGLNALFSGSALIGVIYTLLLQHQTMEQQNQSIQQQNESLEIQKDGLKVQEKSAYEQNFSNGFFVLFERHRKFVDEFEYPSTWLNKPTSELEPHEKNMQDINSRKGELALYYTLYKLVKVLGFSPIPKYGSQLDKIPSLLMRNHPTYFLEVFNSIRTMTYYLSDCAYEDIKERYSTIFKLSLSTQESWFIAYLISDSDHRLLLDQVQSLNLLSDLYYTKGADGAVFDFMKGQIKNSGIEFKEW